MTRTNDDTWDLATSVGATATMVAAARAIATNEGAIDDPFAGPLVRAVGVDFITRWATGELTAADLDDEGTAWGLGQMPAAMAARTRYFDQFFADAAAAGIRQAVILASGLDARAYRLDWPADMTVFEIDQPAVIEFKTTTLAGLAAEPKANLRTVAVDLREDWPTALEAAGFDPDKPSAWIAEGLFGYLPPEAQDRLLDAVTARSARPAADSPAKRCPTWPTSIPRRRGRGCVRRRPSGANTVLTSISPSWAFRVSATTSANTSMHAVGPRSQRRWPNCSPAMDSTRSRRLTTPGRR